MDVLGNLYLYSHLPLRWNMHTSEKRKKILGLLHQLGIFSIRVWLPDEFLQMQLNAEDCELSPIYHSSHLPALLICLFSRPCRCFQSARLVHCLEMLPVSIIIHNSYIPQADKAINSHTFSCDVGSSF